ncbi:hypothetical protein DERF_013489 [Dermatophagoides farinae]|uniref:Uncharacterized protein n=1 Tax=Dermatophagoides farinae TaxID=6954 RepID=A0A922HQA1_DERFA|nr:hypothetical protein DERF_013489 [Dermatophagoides farinae]
MIVTLYHNLIIISIRLFQQIIVHVFELICMKHAVKYLDNNAKDDYEDIVIFRVVQSSINDELDKLTKFIHSDSNKNN